MHYDAVENHEKLIADSVNELLNEEPIFHPLKGDMDGRSVIRREFVRAIKVEYEGSSPIEGYCANISTQGVELITHQAFHVNSKAIIHIESNQRTEFYRFVAECRWVHNDDVGGILSGWSFLKTL